jgi:hypothetical protein
VKKKKKKKLEKGENPRFYGQNQLLFKHPTLQPLGSFSRMAVCRSSLKIKIKVNLKLVLNKTSPHAHTESELDVLGIAGSL